MVFNNYSYEVSYRDIQYPRVELKTGKLLLVLPFGCCPDTFYKKHSDWIFKKINFINGCLDSAKDKVLTERSDGEFKRLIYDIVEKVSLNLKTEIGRVYFRKMRTKWASLSPAKNLTVNSFMKYLPQPLIEYIIFHEFVHIIEKKHNDRFWEIIEKRYKDYQGLERELFEYWFIISNKIDL